MFSTTAVFLRRLASLIEMKRPVPASRPRWVVFFFFFATVVLLLVRGRNQEQLAHARIPDRGDSIAELLLRHREARGHVRSLGCDVRDRCEIGLVLDAKPPGNVG